MFIIDLNYRASLETIDRLLPEHIDYLDKYYSEGYFLISGRKNPRTGGVIICSCSSIDRVWEIVKTDPFYMNQAAEYSITEFTPTKKSARIVFGEDEFLE